MGSQLCSTPGILCGSTRAVEACCFSFPSWEGLSSPADLPATTGGSLLTFSVIFSTIHKVLGEWAVLRQSHRLSLFPALPHLGMVTYTALHLQGHRAMMADLEMGRKSHRATGNRKNPGPGPQNMKSGAQVLSSLPSVCTTKGQNTWPTSIPRTHMVSSTQWELQMLRHVTTILNVMFLPVL